MEEFFKAVMEAEKRLTADIAVGMGHAEAKVRWIDRMWQARNWLPADTEKLEAAKEDWLGELDRKRLARVRPLPAADPSEKSPARQAMEAAGYEGAMGPDATSISVCRREGELLRPVAHYWFRTEWWNMMRPKGYTGKVLQGRGMAELLKKLKEVWT